jgi:hypothetical protein
MRTLVWLAVGLALAVVVEAGGGSVSKRPRWDGRRVEIGVFAWNDARVRATLVDPTGRRTGGWPGRQVLQIPGCTQTWGWEEGSGDEDSVRAGSSATAGVAAVDLPPDSHFSISGTAGKPSLLREGRCTLNLEPVADGKVYLGVTVTDRGAIQCSDSNSVWMKQGTRIKLELRWRAIGDTCSASIVRLSTGKSRR